MSKSAWRWREPANGRLYKEEFDAFEAYSRQKWQFGQDYVDRLISVVQVYTHLLTNCQETKPEHETQVRPLVGLTPEQVQLAWDRAVQKAGSGKITARMVKSVVEELQLASKPTLVAQKPGPTKAERRRLIDDTFGQLLALVSRKADHSLMQEKIEALHGQVQALFSKPPSKA